MSEEAKPNPDSPDSERTLEGVDLRPDTPQAVREAVDKAADYRGDVTVHTGDGQSVVGFVFDRRPTQDPPVFRLLTAENKRVTLRYREVIRLQFSGKDVAFGRSWDAWMRKYEKLKQQGEEPELYPEDL